MTVARSCVNGPRPSPGCRQKLRPDRELPRKKGLGAE